VATANRSRPRRRYGQHFLHDPAVIRRIIQAIDPHPGRAIVEIGPGQGALTWPLLEAAGSLDVIEIDRDLAAGLARRARDGNADLRIHCMDALRFRFDKLAEAAGPLQVVGNLPYSISTPLLFHLLEQTHAIGSMVFMLQKEVAERMMASPGSRIYGRLSVMVQYHCLLKRLLTVGRGAFRPPPRVDSVVLTLAPRPREAHRTATNYALFAQVVAQAFTSRRKTLRNALRGSFTEEDLRGLGVDPGLRPESIGVDQFVVMANWKDCH